MLARATGNEFGAGTSNPAHTALYQSANLCNLRPPRPSPFLSSYIYKARFCFRYNDAVVVVVVVVRARRYLRGEKHRGVFAAAYRSRRVARPFPRMDGRPSRRHPYSFPLRGFRRSGGFSLRLGFGVRDEAARYYARAMENAWHGAARNAGSNENAGGRAERGLIFSLANHPRSTGRARQKITARTLKRWARDGASQLTFVAANGGSPDEIQLETLQSVNTLNIKVDNFSM